MVGVSDTREAPSETRTLIEIRWHARGGQGAVTAAKMVAELALGQGNTSRPFLNTDRSAPAPPSSPSRA